MRNDKKVYAFKRVGNAPRAPNLAPRALNFGNALNNRRMQPRALNFNALNNLNHRIMSLHIGNNAIVNRSFKENNMTWLNGYVFNIYIANVVQILVDAGEFRAANVIAKLDYLHTTIAKNNLIRLSNQEYQAKITEDIAMCHLIDGMRNIANNSDKFNYKKNYLKRMRNQMVQACKDIMLKIRSRKLTREDFVTEFKALYGERPCIENLIQALSDVAYREVGWKGKNASKLLILGQNNKTTNNSRRILRNDVIGTYINPLFKGMTKPQQKLWNSIKNKNVYVINPNVNQQPVYAKLSVIRNARNVSNETYNTYANYLNVPNKYNVLVNAIKKYKKAHRR